MSSGPADRYRRWFEYEKDAHLKVLASLDSVPVVRRDQPPFQRALALMGHVVAARRLWLFRFGVAAERPAGLFPAGVTLAGLGDALEEVARGWDAYLGGLADDDVARALVYESADAGWVTSTVDDVLAQLFGHSSYQRGQVATLVRASGGEPAVTDFVYWSRRPAPAPVRP